MAFKLQKFIVARPNCFEGTNSFMGQIGWGQTFVRLAFCRRGGFTLGGFLTGGLWFCVFFPRDFMRGVFDRITVVVTLIFKQVTI